VKDHGPGGSDHSDGIVRRHVDVKLTRVEGVASHLAFDPGTSFLYIADTGSGRVLRVDTSGGTKAGAMQSKVDRLAEYTRITGTPVEVFAEGLREPSGVDVRGGRVYVAEHATGTIRVFGTDGHEQRRLETGRPGLMGLAIGPEGALWAASHDTSEILRITLGQ
jgi:DNA-binding beta-propeller fold protein YncE